MKKLWDKMKNEGTRGVGLGSLIKWAEQDNPEEYEKLRDQLKKILLENLYLEQVVTLQDHFII